MWTRWFNKKNSAPEMTSGTAAPTQLNVAILSDLGMVRTNNEDMGLFFRIADDDIVRRKGYLMIVADGMGGHQAGEVASNLAARTVSEAYFHTPGKDIATSLEKAFRLANEKIYSMSASNAACRGMGTTCTAVVVTGDEIYYAHAGDSRAYHISGGKIVQVTEDHTYVRELVNAGEINEAEAARHPKRNILTNAMGTKPSLRVDTGKHGDAFGPDDRILLCSDGLYDYLSDQDLLSMLQHRPLQEAAEEMVSEAKRRGGHDNITVILAEKINTGTGNGVRETRDIPLPSVLPVPQTKETGLP